MEDLTKFLQVSSYFLGAIGGLIAVIGGLTGWIVQRAISKNDREHEAITETIKELGNRGETARKEICNDVHELTQDVNFIKGKLSIKDD